MTKTRELLVSNHLFLVVLCFFVGSFFVERIEADDIEELFQSNFEMVFSKDLQPYQLTQFWPSEDFKKSFLKYWNFRFMGDAQGAFEFEAPYFQEIVNRPRYTKVLEASETKISKIELVSREQKTERLHHIVFKVYKDDELEDRHGISILDQWVMFRGKWYHVWRDRIFFPAAS